MGWVKGLAPSWREGRGVGAGFSGDCRGGRCVPGGRGGGRGVSSPKGSSSHKGEAMPLWAGPVVGGGVTVYLVDMG